MRTAASVRACAVSTLNANALDRCRALVARNGRGIAPPTSSTTMSSRLRTRQPPRRPGWRRRRGHSGRRGRRRPAARRPRSRATLASWSSVRAEISTSAPGRASAIAVAAPMPWPALVTTAARPVTRKRSKTHGSVPPVGWRADGKLDTSLNSLRRGWASPGTWVGLVGEGCLVARISRAGCHVFAAPGVLGTEQRSGRRRATMARTLSLIVRNVVFTIVAPGLGGVWAPWRIVTDDGGTVTPATWSAAVVIAAGAVLYGWCVWNFAAVGQGTPGRWTRRSEWWRPAPTAGCATRLTSARCWSCWGRRGCSRPRGCSRMRPRWRSAATCS